MKSPPEEFSDDHIPLGYLITIRAYGTWLHGSAGSVDRFHNNYGTPKLRAGAKRKHTIGACLLKNLSAWTRRPEAPSKKQ
jgi:hypothetical protein